jgi:hypothetical protein
VAIYSSAGTEVCRQLRAEADTRDETVRGVGYRIVTPAHREL